MSLLIEDHPPAIGSNGKPMRMTDDDIATIFMINRPVLLRFLTARGRGLDPDDLLQELWMKVQSLDASMISEPAAYLFKMADNLVNDLHRANVRRIRRDDAWSGAVQGTIPTASNQSSAEHSLIARQQLRTVNEAIDALGERTALIFRSYRLEGMSQRDISIMTGISLSAVEKHLQKAYRALIDVRRQLDMEPLPQNGDARRRKTRVDR